MRPARFDDLESIEAIDVRLIFKSHAESFVFPLCRQKLTIVRDFSASRYRFEGRAPHVV